MNVIEAIIKIMEKSGVTNAQLGKRIGVTNTAIWDRLKNKQKTSMKVNVAAQMLNALDYKIIVVPSSKKLQEGEYELK